MGWDLHVPCLKVDSGGMYLSLRCSIWLLVVGNKINIRLSIVVFVSPAVISRLMPPEDGMSRDIGHGQSTDRVDHHRLSFNR